MVSFNQSNYRNPIKPDPIRSLAHALFDVVAQFSESPFACPIGDALQKLGHHDYLTPAHTLLKL